MKQDMILEKSKGFFQIVNYHIFIGDTELRQFL